MWGSHHFKILASKAYACVPGVKRQELDATSAKGIFTGLMMEEIMILCQNEFVARSSHVGPGFAARPVPFDMPSFKCVVI